MGTVPQQDRFPGPAAAANDTGADRAPGAAREIVVVDMDRTLLATDMTMENVLALIGRKPLLIPKLIGWALKGRAVMKARLAEHVMPETDLAPVNPEVVEYLEKKKSEGAMLVLASASNETIVRAVADRVGLFDAVHGSNESNNFKGSAKADFLDETYGKGGYTYVGDSPSDLKIWSRGGKIVTAGAPKALRRKAEKLATGEVTHLDLESRSAKTYWRGLIKCIRPYQWSKNVLIFVPMLAGQALTTPNIIHAVIAFAVFSLTASSVYLLNDMLDLDADRAHPRKRKRAFAAGTVPIKDGIVIAPLLLVTAFATALAFLPLAFILVLSGYYVATLSYSLWLKQKIMVDVFLLAALYTFRVIAGGAATGVPMSEWLIGFSLFFFLALAIVKRLAELVDIVRNDKGRASKRDYMPADLGMVQALGAAAGFASILVLTLYFQSEKASGFYTTPEFLYALSPLMLFWMSRMLVLANRGEVDDDPIVFAAKDRTSRLVGLVAAVIILAAVNVTWPA